MWTPATPGALTFATPSPPSTRHGRREREPICSALAKPEQLNAKVSKPQSMPARRQSRFPLPPSWRAEGQGGGGGPKTRPWRRIKYQLQITINKDPGKAGSVDVRHPLPTLHPPLMAWEGADLQRLALCRSGEHSSNSEPLSMPARRQFGFPQPPFVAGGGLREGVANRKCAPGAESIISYKSRGMWTPA